MLAAVKGYYDGKQIIVDEMIENLLMLVTNLLLQY